jgi:hypothetical protein
MTGIAIIAGTTWDSMVVMRVPSLSLETELISPSYQ